MSILKRPRIGWRDPDAAYVIAAGVNDTIHFTESAGALSGTVAAGTYSDLELAGLMKAAMDAAGLGTYAVYRDGDTGLFYITRTDSAVNFSLQVVGAATPLWPDVGFTTNRAGAVSYASDDPTPLMVYLDLEDPVRGPNYEDSEDTRVDHRSLSGRRYSATPGALKKTWSADLRFHTFAALDAYRDFLIWALHGGVFRWWPDAGDASRWVSVQLDENKYGPRERLPAFKNWDQKISLVEAVPNAGTIGLEDLQDR